MGGSAPRFPSRLGRLETTESHADDIPGGIKAPFSLGHLAGKAGVVLHVVGLFGLGIGWEIPQKAGVSRSERVALGL